MLSNDNPKFGYNAATGKYEDLMAAGIIDPTKASIPPDLRLCKCGSAVELFNVRNKIHSYCITFMFLAVLLFYGERVSYINILGQFLCYAVRRIYVVLRW